MVGDAVEALFVLSSDMMISPLPELMTWKKHTESIHSPLQVKIFRTTESR